MDERPKTLGVFIYQFRNFGGKMVYESVKTEHGQSSRVIALEDAAEMILLTNQQGQPAVHVVPIGTMTINSDLGLLAVMSKDSPFYKAYYQTIAGIKLV